MKKIEKVIKEMVDVFFETRKMGKLKKDIIVTIGPSSGLPKGTKKNITIPKGTEVEVFHYGPGDYNVHVNKGKFKGQEISRKTAFSDIKF